MKIENLNKITVQEIRSENKVVDLSSYIDLLKGREITKCLNAIAELKDIAQAKPDHVLPIWNILVSVASERDCSTDIRDICITNLHALVPILEKEKINELLPCMIHLLEEEQLEEENLLTMFICLLELDLENLIPIFIEKFNEINGYSGEILSHERLIRVLTDIIINHGDSLKQKEFELIADCMKDIWEWEKKKNSDPPQLLINADIIGNAFLRLTEYFSEKKLTDFLINATKGVEYPTDCDVVKIPAISQAALKSVDKLTDEVLKQLVDLSDCWSIIWILGELVSQKEDISQEAITTLLQCLENILKSSNIFHQILATDAIGKMARILNHDQKIFAVELIRSSLDCKAAKDFTLQKKVGIWVLGKIAMTEKNSKIIGDVITILKTTMMNLEDALRYEVVKTLGKLIEVNGNHQFEIFNACIEWLKDRDALIRQSAASSLRELVCFNSDFMAYSKSNLISEALKESMHQPPTVNLEYWVETQNNFTELFDTMSAQQIVLALSQKIGI